MTIFKLPPYLKDLWYVYSSPKPCFCDLLIASTEKDLYDCAVGIPRELVKQTILRICAKSQHLSFPGLIKTAL